MKYLITLLVVITSLTFCGCKTVQTAPSITLVCTEQAILDKLPTLLPQVLEALGKEDWEPTLDSLIAAAASAALCAVQEIITQLESFTDGGINTNAFIASPTVSTETRLARARIYLYKHTNQ